MIGGCVGEERRRIERVRMVRSEWQLQLVNTNHEDSVDVYLVNLLEVVELVVVGM